MNCDNCGAPLKQSKCEYCGVINVNTIVKESIIEDNESKYASNAIYSPIIYTTNARTIWKKR